MLRSHPPGGPSGWAVLISVTWTCHLSDSGWWFLRGQGEWGQGLTVSGGDSWAHPQDSGSELEPPGRRRAESHPYFLGWPVA